MPAKIKVLNNGPLFIEGDFQIVDAEGNAFDLAGRTSLALCRCGHSANRPFCDGSHKSCGFLSEDKARVLPPPKPKL
ncbi:MAG: CDGSH iron-sulfur domain-containing protein [Candidatus Acidiferrales bacterium]